ncbi:MAG: NADP-dependent oxidoreductase [Candidatus Limnocylindrales bacterium]
MLDSQPAPRMRAFVKRSADQDDIALQDVPIPAIGEDELLIDVRAVGVGIHDSYFLSTDISYPYPIGIEAAGEVAEVGGRVTSYRPGDRLAFISVMQPKGGTWAEFAAVAMDALILTIPEGMSFEQAAAVPVAGSTALKALHMLPIQSRDSLFIAGASGAVGTLAIQLAKARGWRVAASASQANQEYLRSLGADLTVDYREADWPAQVRGWAPGGVDAAVAIQPGTSADTMQTIREGGFLVTVSGDRIEPERGIGVAVVTQQIDVRPELTELMDGIADGGYRLALERTYPFAEGLDALRKVQSRHARGKVVLLVA